jgi:microcin C transport system permease protein
MNPVLTKQLLRFKKNKRGYYSFWILCITFLLSLGSEFLANNSPLLVKYEGKLFFPVLKFYPATVFGGEDVTEPDYKALKVSTAFQKPGNFILMPLIPYGPNESMSFLTDPPPTKPSSQNLLGTDDRGRDLLTRLIYGFRNSMLFALVSWVGTVILAYLFGAAQGYFGGKIDFYGQRFSEIWSALPVLYIIIFLIAIFPSSLVLLTITWVVFSWLGLASYLRVEVLKVRKLDYVTSARALGAKSSRIIFRHILPNTLTPIITFSPFIISASIGSLAALDYLGLGLPPPTASWGELLHQGKENLTSWWLSVYPFFFLFITSQYFASASKSSYLFIPGTIP